MNKWWTVYNIDTFLDSDIEDCNEYQHRDYSFNLKKAINNTIQLYIDTDGGKTITMSLGGPKAKEVIRQLVKDGSLINKTTDELEAMGVCVSPIKYTYNVYKGEIYKYDGSLDHFGVVYDNEGKEVRRTFVPVTGGLEFSADSLEQAIAYLAERGKNDFSTNIQR